MRNLLSIIWVFAVVLLVSPAEARVCFITDPACSEALKVQCPSSYITCKSSQNGVGLICGANKYKDCVCKPEYNQVCTGDLVGDGEDCDGKYAKCKCGPDFKVCPIDKDGQGTACTVDGEAKYKTCKCKSEFAYTTSNCTGNNMVSGKTCTEEDGTIKYNQCVCDPSKYTKTCTGTGEQGVGTACQGKYQSCTCKSNYTTCSCGAAGGASVCTADGANKYSACNACCDDFCGGYRTIPSASQCPDGYNSTTTGCGNVCYKCKSCSCKSSVPPPSCPCPRVLGSDDCGNTCWGSGTTTDSCHFYYMGQKLSVVKECGVDENGKIYFIRRTENYCQDTKGNKMILNSNDYTQYTLNWEICKSYENSNKKDTGPYCDNDSQAVTRQTICRNAFQDAGKL